MWGRLYTLLIYGLEIMCDNRSLKNFVKIILVAESALPTRRPCAITLSLKAVTAAVSFGQYLPEAAAVALFYVTNKAMPSSEAENSMSPSVLW